jgi:hypothetical protein
MKAELVGENLVITIPFNKAGTPAKSSNGKTLLHSSSGGGQKIAGLEVEGRPVTVSVLAYTPNPNFKK